MGSCYIFSPTERQSCIPFQIQSFEPVLYVLVCSIWPVGRTERPHQASADILQTRSTPALFNEGRDCRSGWRADWSVVRMKERTTMTMRLEKRIELLKQLFCSTRRFVAHSNFPRFPVFAFKNDSTLECCGESVVLWYVRRTRFTRVPRRFQTREVTKLNVTKVHTVRWLSRREGSHPH